jgi:tetratricopeptide (TPR) repeat protein
MHNIRSSLIVGLSLLAVQPASAQLPYWRTHTVQGEAALQSGNYAQAEQEFKLAAEEAHKLGENDPRLAMTLRSLGKLYMQDGRPSDAQRVLKQALAINRKALGADDAEVTSTEQEYQQSLGAAATHSEPTPKSQTVRDDDESAPSAQQSSPDRSPPAAVRDTTRVPSERGAAASGSSSDLTTSTFKEAWKKGAESYKRADFAAAEQQFKEAARLANHVSPAAVAVSLNALLRTLYADRKFTQAEPVYQQSMTLVEQRFGKHSPQYLQTERGYASLLRKLGRIKEADQIAKETAPTKVKLVPVRAFTFTKHAEAPIEESNLETAMVPPSEETIEEEESHPEEEQQPKGFLGLPMPHEPNLMRLAFSIIGSLAALKGATKLGLKISQKLIPEQIDKNDREKIDKMSLLCNTTVIWWIIPFFGVIGALICREFARNYKPRAKKYKKLSTFAFTMSGLGWIAGIVYAVFFR